MKWTLTFVLIAACSAQGASAASRYDELVALYQRGTKPTILQMEGAFSGRCFVKAADGSSDENAPLEALLVSKARNPDAGPAFHSDDPLKVLLLMRESGLNPSFDHLSKKDVDWIFTKNQDATGILNDSGDARSWVNTYFDAGLDLESGVRTSDEYLVVKGLLEDYTVIERKEGDVACYFYIRLND